MRRNLLNLSVRQSLHCKSANMIIKAVPVSHMTKCELLNCNWNRPKLITVLHSLYMLHDMPSSEIDCLTWTK